MVREYPSRRYKNICWVILLAALAAYFPTLYYNDIIITYKHALAFLNCVWDGKLFDFYCAQTYMEEVGMMLVPIYPLPIYLVFAVWNLPIWVLMRMGLVWHVENAWCLMWCKGLLVAAMAGVCWLLCDILRQVGKKREECEEAVFLLLTSLLFVAPILATAQYDVLCVLLMLLGIRQRLRDGRLSWKVMVIFSLAVTFKFFALFVYVIMVLLDEKRVWKVIRALLAGLAGMVLIDLPFEHIEYAKDVTTNMEALLQTVFAGNIQAGLGQLPLFPCALFGVCVAAYCMRPNGREQYLKTCAWLVSAVFFGLLLLAHCHPYWGALLPPFVVLLLAMNPERLHLNLLLDSIGSLVLVLYQGYVFDWVYFCDNGFSWLLLKNVPLAGKFHNLTDMVAYWDLQDWVTLPYAAFAVTFAALLYLNRPQRSAGYQDEELNTVLFQKGLYAFRVFCVIGFLLLTLGIAYVW